MHGAAMTAWFLLLLLQSLLIATGRRSIHRRTGIAGAVIAVVITRVNPFVVVWGVPEGLAAGMPIELVTFITIADLSAMVVFAVLTGLALSWRRHPEAHSRLLLLASNRDVQSGVRTPVDQHHWHTPGRDINSGRAALASRLARPNRDQAGPPCDDLGLNSSHRVACFQHRGCVSSPRWASPWFDCWSASASSILWERWQQSDSHLLGQMNPGQP